MKKVIIILGVVLFSNAFAYEVGDTVPNLCWTDATGVSVCLDHYPDTVKVVDFGAGWCGPCNSKMSELARRVSEFDGMRVKFFSNSIHGWQNPSSPSAQFLNEWRNRHKIPASMAVVAAPIQQLYEFSPEGYIPALAVIDQNNVMSYREVGASINTVFAEVRRLLATR
ncbi:MAG: redoxin family protein [Bdellovibrionaceae bacterium]|nr:redoxin family protein [Bdellovibrionales bacterium]MCB9255241.1 redoxin family protein [Pseudobdellovibrionaceae bacterium]